MVDSCSSVSLCAIVAQDVQRAFSKLSARLSGLLEARQNQVTGLADSSPSCVARELLPDAGARVRGIGGANHEHGESNGSGSLVLGMLAVV